MSKKIEILPVLNCTDRDSLVRKLRLLEDISEAGDRIHLDIADGVFTFHKTWNEPAVWPTLGPKRELEVHLMVAEPEKFVEPWLSAGAKRIIIHYESLFDFKTRPKDFDSRKTYDAVRAMIARYGAELMLSHNPETPAENLVYHSEGVHAFQVLAVQPGLAGQSFLTPSLEKISFLRRNFPNATIEVDGGVTPDIVRRAKDAGADAFTSDSYIFNHGDPKRNLEELKKI